jgi:SnoaL-like domain
MASLEAGAAVAEPFNDEECVVIRCTKIEDLPAILEIYKLKAQYFRFVDTKEWDQLASLFTPDATLFFPESQTEPADLKTTIDFFIKALEGGVSIHHGHMPEIEILSSHSAHGIWAMEDTIYWPSDRPTIHGCEYIHGYGHYHEDYLRAGDRWLIKTLKLTRLWVQKIAPARSVT